MASLPTSTMALSFDGHDDYPQIGGMVSSQLTWEPDAYGVATMAGIGPADVNMPGNLMDGTFVIHSDFPSKSTDWDSGDLHLFPDLENGVHSDGGFLDLESLINEVTPQPFQEPYTAADAVKNEVPLASSCSELSTLEEVSFDSSKTQTSPGSPDSGIYSLPSPESDFSFESAVSPGSEEITTLEDITFLESLCSIQPGPTESPAVPQTGPGTLLTTIALDSFQSLAPQTISPPITPSKASKPTKVLSTKEKKERKRAQNKNAATRYREKKRAEARGIYEEQTELEEKHKSLKDKVTLISREIEYMKELLIEVYRTKGVIK